MTQPLNALHSAALVALMATTTLGGAQNVRAQTFTPIHPPAAPLITRAPYVNTWLGNSSGIAPGARTKFWDGTDKPITGIAFIDGAAYLFLGAPASTSVANTMRQASLQTTPTRSIFKFEGGGVELTLDFLSPVEATDLKRLSMPLSDIITSVRSSNGASHTVSIYFDIAGEWAHGGNKASINWTPETIGLAADGSGTAGSLAAWTVTPSRPVVFEQKPSYPSWGRVLWATASADDLTTQSGQDSLVRGQFISTGRLAGTNDTDQPRAIDDKHPVFSFAKSFGTVTATPSEPFTLLLGHERDPAINYLGRPIRSLWTQYWPSYEAMLAFAYNDREAAVTRSESLDLDVTKAATAVGGPQYSSLTALLLRQAFAGTELTNATNDPYMFIEEISSDDNVQSVDLIYPAMPVFLYLNPKLLRYLVAPIIAYTESGKWPEAFAPHDLGTRYPNAAGHNKGGGENMPVEATAGMLIMADAYMQHVPSAEAASYAKAHYPMFKQWADYLLTVPPGVAHSNAVDPQYQKGTTDVLGFSAHNVNLALKGIIAVGAMGQIATLAGDAEQAQYYSQQAQRGIGTWAKLSQNTASTHLLLNYREPANAYSPSTLGEADTEYSLKYNVYADKLLGLNLVPKSIVTEEAAFYSTLEHPNGILLQPETIADPPNPRTHFTTAFWELWTAAAMGDRTLEQNLIDEVFHYANTSTSGRAFPDRYDPTGSYNSFEARSVMGGAFAPLLSQQTSP